jgi:hypothetical protein
MADQDLDGRLGLKGHITTPFHGVWLFLGSAAFALVLAALAYSTMSRVVVAPEARFVFDAAPRSSPAIPSNVAASVPAMGEEVAVEARAPEGEDADPLVEPSEETCTPMGEEEAAGLDGLWRLYRLEKRLEAEAPGTIDPLRHASLRSEILEICPAEEHGR